MHRLNEHEVIYHNILQQLQIGRCDKETAQAISHQKPELKNGDGSIHFYFTNLLGDAHNITHLDTLPGGHVPFTAVHTGDLQGQNCPATKKTFISRQVPQLRFHTASTRMFITAHRGCFVRKLGKDAAVIRVGGVNILSIRYVGHNIGPKMQMPRKLHWQQQCTKPKGSP